MHRALGSPALSQQLEGCDFIVFPTPHPFVLEAFPPPGPQPQPTEAGPASLPGQADERSLSVPKAALLGELSWQGAAGQWGCQTQLSGSSGIRLPLTLGLC